MSILDEVHDRLSKASIDARDAKSKAQAFASQQMGVEYVDLSVRFTEASGIPKKDVVGTVDPYFVANLDNHIKFVCVWSQSRLSSKT